MKDEDEAPEFRCPRCGGATICVGAAVKSACLPFPPVRPIRCEGCGHEGTWARIGGRDAIQWGKPVARE